MSFGEYITEDMRLVMLRILSESAGYSSNSSLIAAGLTLLGHSQSRDKIKTELHWLAEQSLIKVQPIGDLLVATLTERGQDVAEGKAVAHGVKKGRAN